MKLATKTVILLTALTMTGQAGATVATGARAVDDYSNAQSSSGYNVSWDGYGNRSTGLLGPTSFYSAGYNCPGCSASSSGTTTPGTDATSSVDHATASVPQGAVGTAYARANLATGQLGVETTAQSYPIVGYTSAVVGQAFAALGQGVDFTVAGATAATVTDIGVTVDVHGNMSGSSYLQEQLGFSSPGVADATFLTEISGAASSPPAVTLTSAGGWVSYSVTPDSPDHFVFHGVYALTGASQHVDIGDVLYAESYDGLSNYAHTSDFSLQLPSGVTFTSDSGVFLGGAVPEPATWSIMLGGLFLIGGCLRRRRGAMAESLQA